MPKPSTRNDSTSEAPKVVSADVIEGMVNDACQKAMEVLKAELTNMFSGIVSRMQSIEQRMDITEKKTTDHNVVSLNDLNGLNDLSSRVMEVQCSVDRLEALGTNGNVGGCVQDCMQEIEAIRAESRAAICAANEVEQYSCRNNIRIRGLTLAEGEDNRSTVVSFLNEKLNVGIFVEDIEAAHTLPRANQVDTADLSTTHATSSGTQQQRGPPMIIVRFRKNEVRDNVLRKRRVLKQTRFSMVKDLTTLNSKTLSRASRDPAVAAAWSWNGKINILKKSGGKMTLKPFQMIC